MCAVRINESEKSINVVMSAILILFGFLWLIAFVAGKTDALGQNLRPYLPSWFDLVNLLLVPITGALAGSRLVSFRVGFLFVLIFVAQLSLLGLSSEKYPLLKGGVVIFLYYETFLLIPKWNRRISEKSQEGRVLNLGQ
jgi:phosphate starvation-inducible membrane PsiE